MSNGYEQIKIFTGNTAKDVEMQVNKWLQEGNYLEITYRGAVVTGVDGDRAAASQSIASLTIWYRT